MYRLVFTAALDLLVLRQSSNLLGLKELEMSIINFKH